MDLLTVHLCRQQIQVMQIYTFHVRKAAGRQCVRNRPVLLVSKRLLSLGNRILPRFSRTFSSPEAIELPGIRRSRSEQKHGRETDIRLPGLSALPGVNMITMAITESTRPTASETEVSPFRKEARLFRSILSCTCWIRPVSAFFISASSIWRKTGSFSWEICSLAREQ